MAKSRGKTPRGVRRRERKDGSVVFYAVVKVNGRQHTGKFRVDPEEAHRDYLQMKADPVQISITAGQRSRALEAVPTLGKSLKAAIALKRSQGSAIERTIETAERNIKVLLRYFHASAPLRDITAEHINRFIKQAERDYSLNTIRGKFLQLLKEAFTVAKVPWPENVRTIRVADPDMPFFTPEELQELLLEVRTRVIPLRLRKREVHAALFEFLACTGARGGELARMRIADIDIDRRTVRIANHKDAKVIRRIPFSKDLLPSIDLLSEKKVLDANVWPGGEPGQWSVFRAWQARLNEPRLNGRALRHTFVTSLLIAGVDPYTVMELAGHKSLQTTMKYVHLVSPHKRDAAEKLARLFRQDS